MTILNFDSSAWDLLRKSGRSSIVLESYVESLIYQAVPLDPDLEEQLISNFPGHPFLSESDVLYSSTLNERLKLFKKYTFTPQIEEYYFRTRSLRDQLIFSMLRTKNLSRLQELFLSIREGEIEFATAAIRWSEGPESAVGGRVGPILASNAGHPELCKRLSSSTEGEYVGPFAIGDTHVLLRLDKRINSRLDATLSAMLVEELYRNWLIEQIDLLVLGETIDPIEFIPE